MSDESRAGSSRRTTLKFLSATAAASVVGSGVASSSSGYSNVVDMVEAGADPNGNESITPILREHKGDDTKFVFQEGRYYMDEQFRFTNFNHVAFVGEDATIVPANYHDHQGAPRLFKLGTYTSPGRNLHFEGIDFDFSAADTGLRAIQAQIDDGLLVKDVTVTGEHDSGNYGPFLFDVTAAGGNGRIENVRLPDGGEYSKNTPGDVSVGPIGILVSRHHEGVIRFQNCEIGAFPDNGLYASRGSTVEVLGGHYHNSNVASIRIGGDGSFVKNATITVDRNRDDDVNQPGIRLDQGPNLRVENTVVNLVEPNGHGILVQNDVESAEIHDVQVNVPKRTYDGIRVNPEAGPTTISNASVQLDASSYAFQLRPRRGSGGPVEIVDSTVRGDGGGERRRAAIRCDRSGTELRNVSVVQTGGTWRRAIEIDADDCLVYGGDYTSFHHPIISNADGTTIEEVEDVNSTEGYEAVKLIGGNSDVTIVNNWIRRGVDDGGTTNLTMYGNRTDPEGESKADEEDSTDEGSTDEESSDEPEEDLSTNDSGDSSTDDTSSGDSSTDDTSSGDSSTDDTSSGDSSTDDTSSGDSSTDDTSTSDTSSDDTSSGDTDQSETTEETSSSDSQTEEEGSTCPG